MHRSCTLSGLELCSSILGVYSESFFVSYGDDEGLFPLEYSDRINTEASFKARTRN